GMLAKSLSKRRLGKVPESLGMMWHSQPVLRTFFGFFAKAEKWDKCDRQLSGEVGQVRPPTEVVRAHGHRVARGLQRLPRSRVFRSEEPQPRPRQGPRGAALARVRPVHAARARRPGVR